MSAREADERWMRRCLELARRAEGRTAPNPMVGCVIVDGRGRLVAEGHHERAGTPHAEAVALAAAGKRARGATLYVNLEPCRHIRRRRTEPCAPKVAEAGLRRVVLGMGDPIRSHAGGAAWLVRQGVEVTRDVLRAECAELNRAFVTWARERRPLLVLKAAATLDGRVATHTGESKWITSSAARRDGHRLRDRLDAIVVGVGTVLADDPALTVRGLRGGRDPVRVVVDSRLRTPPTARLLPAHSRSRVRVIVATTERAPRSRERALQGAGAEVWRLPAGEGGRVDLAALAGGLAEAEVTSALVEGGPGLHAAFAAADLVDEVRLYLAPRVLGGEARSVGPGWLGGPGVAELAAGWELAFHGDAERLGPDLALTLRPRRRRR